MSTPQTPLEHQHITPPSSFVDAPLTPPPTDEKAFTQAPRVIALFKDIQAGRHIKQHPWTEFQLAQEEYDEIERRLSSENEGFWYDKGCIDQRNEQEKAISVGMVDMIYRRARAVIIILDDTLLIPKRADVFQGYKRVYDLVCTSAGDMAGRYISDPPQELA